MLKIKEKVKTFCKRSKQAVMSSITALTVSYMCAATPVYASDAYLNPINKFKIVMIPIVATAGSCVLVYGGVKFAESFQKKDQNGEYSAIYTIIAGGIMLGISAFVAALT